MAIVKKVYLDGKRVTIKDLDLNSVIDNSKTQDDVAHYITLKQEDRLQYVIDRAKRTNQSTRKTNSSDKSVSKRNSKTKRATDGDSSDAG